MKGAIIITGATDGIGAATARLLAAEGWPLVVHGRDPRKLETLIDAVSRIEGAATLSPAIADLSKLADVAALAQRLSKHQAPIHALINNAGVFRIGEAETVDGLDARFAVNTIAPYILATRLSSRLGPAGRIVNVSSAAQAPVEIDALAGRAKIADAMSAYAQSKLALTMWSRSFNVAASERPQTFSVNPGSLLGTKMVREGFNVSGGDVQVGARILARAAVAPEFADASGRYFDNDAERFADPHRDALDSDKCAAVVAAIEHVLRTKGVDDAAKGSAHE